jgi:hypothetical protein
MPAFRDIDPVAIGQRLRYVWAWKYVREPDDFINRLAGEEIVHALGKAPRGLKMTEFFDPKVYRTLSPPASARRAGAGILGATIYFASAGVGAATSFDTEKLDFYPLD